MIRLIALLGNPGTEYRRTRHNAAWLLADHFSFSGGLSWQEKFRGRWAALSPGAAGGDGKLFLLMPQTFMNLTGECVRDLMGFFKILPSELAAVHDEVELPFGTAGFRFGGGLGGHNGLRSLQKNLATADFYRFRIGIGRPARGDVSSHVLGKFSPEEEPLLEYFLGKAAGILEECVRDPEPAEKKYKKALIL